MKIFVGSDHAGFHLRQQLVQSLRKKGHEVENVGPSTPDEVDFPDVSREVGHQVRTSPDNRGILICGSGVGVSIAANKIPGIRAALAHDVYSAHQGVEHDDANVLCLGAQVIGPWLAEDLVDAFVGARLEHREDFLRRVGQIGDLEKEAAREAAR